MHLDKRLSLKDHMQNRLKQANYNLKLIQNIQEYINIDTTKMLLSTMVQSQLDYVNSILTRAPITMIKPYKKSITLQPEWPMISQKEKMLAYA